MGTRRKDLSDVTHKVHQSRTATSYDMGNSELKSDALHNEGLLSTEADPRYTN